MSNSLRLFFALLFSAVVGCSPKADPPSINSPIKPINVEACRTASLNLRVLEAKGVRDLISCLNGDNGALAPYKKFVDEMDTDELNQLLQIYNLHIASDDNRLNQALDTIDRMHHNGWLGSFMKDLQVMTETGTAQKILPILSRFFENDAQPGRVDPNLKGLYSYVVKLIDRGLMTGVINAGAGMTGGLRSKALAYVVSSDNASSVIHSDGFVDLFADQIVAMFDDETFHSVATHLSDPHLHPANSLKVLTPGEIEETADILSYLPQGATAGTDKLEKLRRVVQGADVPLTCFKDGKRSRYAPNLLKMMGREAMKRAPGPDTDAFFMQVVPMLLVTTKESCDFSPDVVNNFQIDEQIARDGYAGGHRALFKLLLYGNRFEETTDALKSPHISGFSPLLEELGIRGGTLMGLQLLANEMTSTDAKSVAAALDALVDGDLHDAQLVTWIRNNVKDSSSDVLVKDVDQLQAGQKTLLELSLRVAGDPGQDQALRDLKNAVAKGPFTGSPELSVVAIARKFLRNEGERRAELKAFAASAVKALADRRGGVGDMLAVFAEAAGLSQDTPFQKIWRDSLADEKLTDAVTPILWKITRQKNFADTIEFTGRLAASGELEKLLEFLTELFKNSNKPGLVSPPLANAYVKPIGDGSSYLGSVKPFHPQPPNTTYDQCLSLSGSLFDNQGRNLYAGVNCINATGGYPALSQAAEHLKAAGLLPETSDLLRNLIVTSPYIGGSLNELQTLWNSGDLNRLLNLFAISGDDKYRVPYILDDVLNDAFRHKGMPGLLKLAGKISQMSEITTAGPAAIDVLEKPARKTFHSNNNFLMPIPADQVPKLKSQIRNNFPNWTDAQINESYEQAAARFAAHDDGWYYDTGPYNRYTDDQWKQQVYAFLAGLLRNDADLAEFVAALQDIAAHMRPADFLRHAVLDRRIAVHYSDDGKPMVRIITLFEQLEELTEDSDFNMPVVGHVGTNFQLAVVHATDLSSAMHKQHTLTEAGEKMAATLMKHREQNHFKSMLANFSGLQEIADSQELRIFQRLYQAMYNATPSGDKEKKDASVNHMGIFFHANHLQIFSAIAVALNNAEQQRVDSHTTQLDVIVNGVMNLPRLMQAKDIPALRQVLLALVTKARAGDDMPLNVLLDKFLALMKNPAAYQEFKDTLFTLAPSVNRLQVEPTGLFKALPSLVTQPRTWNDAIDKFMEDGSSPGGKIFTVGANLQNIDEVSMNAFRKIGTVVLTDDPQTGENYLPSVVALLSDGYAVRPAEYSKINKAVSAYVSDPRVVATHPSDLLKNVFGELAGQSGLGMETGTILTDDLERQRLIRIGYDLTKNKDVAGLSQILVNLVNTGGIDSALHFVFDNLLPGSVTSKKAVRNR